MIAKKFFGFNQISRNSAQISCGLQQAVLTVDRTGWLIFGYEIKGRRYETLLSPDKEGVENVLWEWLCTLSRATRRDNNRVLGSYWLAAS